MCPKRRRRIAQCDGAGGLLQEITLRLLAGAEVVRRGKREVPLGRGLPRGVQLPVDLLGNLIQFFRYRDFRVVRLG